MKIGNNEIQCLVVSALPYQKSQCRGNGENTLFLTWSTLVANISRKYIMSLRHELKDAQRVLSGGTFGGTFEKRKNNMT
ncbi:MAG: hypothetical protein MUO63_00780 [Desulfobulbaceae bacterium]|nr:hypothetical protein [Desulfobulbaceae bacterium]